MAAPQTKNENLAIFIIVALGWLALAYVAIEAITELVTQVIEWLA